MSIHYTEKELKDDIPEILLFIVKRYWKMLSYLGVKNTNKNKWIACITVLLKLEKSPNGDALFWGKDDPECWRRISSAKVVGEEILVLRAIQESLDRNYEMQT